MDALQRIEIVTADITREDVDAIVNAANVRLANGGGVARAIRLAAGAGFQAECDALGWCPPAGAVVTGSGNLPCRQVIHTVGPIWKQEDGREAELLAEAHRAVIAKASEIGARTISLPAISCGIYGYPLEKAAPVALSATLEALEAHPGVERVRFCFIAPFEKSFFDKALAELG